MSKNAHTQGSQAPIVPEDRHRRQPHGTCSSLSQGTHAQDDYEHYRWFQELHADPLG